MKELIGISLVLLGDIIGGFGGLYLKKGADRFAFNPLKLIKNRELILGVVFYGLGTLVFIIALRFGPLSLLYPFVSLTYAWIALLSMKFLKEKIGKVQWAGIITILLGVVLIGLG